MANIPEARAKGFFPKNCCPPHSSLHLPNIHHPHLRGRRPCQPTGLRVRQPESANRKARVSQQEGASQQTGRRESANRKARVSQPGWRESDNQVASQTARTTRSRVRQPGRESDNRSRASQPGHESANQVASQPTRSRVRQPVASQPTGHESANQVASQPTRSRVRQPGRTQDTKRNAMK